jgi:hypothetical protein
LSESCQDRECCRTCSLRDIHSTDSYPEEPTCLARKLRAVWCFGGSNVQEGRECTPSGRESRNFPPRTAEASCAFPGTCNRQGIVCRFYLLSWSTHHQRRESKTYIFSRGRSYLPVLQHSKRLQLLNRFRRGRVAAMKWGWRSRNFRGRCRTGVFH